MKILRSYNLLQSAYNRAIKLYKCEWLFSSTWGFSARTTLEVVSIG